MARAASVVPAGRAPRRWFVVVAAALLLGATGCLPPAQQPLTVWAVRGEEPLAADTPPTLESEVYSATRGQLTLDAAINETIRQMAPALPSNPNPGVIKSSMKSRISPTAKRTISS